jgi:secreted trypsin-like serine protease
MDDPMYLKGIVSFGTKKCGKGFPGVYINVTYYIPWILETLKP